MGRKRRRSSHNSNGERDSATSSPPPPLKARRREGRAGRDEAAAATSSTTLPGSQRALHKPLRDQVRKEHQQQGQIGHHSVEHVRRQNVVRRRAEEERKQPQRRGKRGGNRGRNGTKKRARSPTSSFSSSSYYSMSSSNSPFSDDDDLQSNVSNEEEDSAGMDPNERFSFVSLAESQTHIQEHDEYLRRKCEAGRNDHENFSFMSFAEAQREDDEAEAHLMDIQNRMRSSMNEEGRRRRSAASASMPSSSLPVSPVFNDSRDNGDDDENAPRLHLFAPPVTDPSGRRQRGAEAASTRQCEGRWWVDHAERPIASFLERLQITHDEQTRRQRAFDTVNGIARSLGFHCYVFGSAVTGVVLPSSDIDVCLTASPIDEETGRPSQGRVSLVRPRRAGASPEYQLMLNGIRRSREFSRIVPVAHARVPIIKCFHTRLRVEVDVSFAPDGLTTSSYLIKEFDQGGVFRHARSIVILVKHLLHKNQCDDPSNGGMGSFVVSLLVLFFLKHHASKRYQSATLDSPGALFALFLQYWSSSFDHRRYGIDYEANTAFGKERDDVLYIKNPIEPSRNCASACTRFSTSVKALFRRCYEEMKKEFSEGGGASSPPPASPIGSPTSTNGMEQPLGRALGSELPEWRVRQSLKRYSVEF